MKVFTSKVIIIQPDIGRAVRHTSAETAAQHWAKEKSDAWVEKMRGAPKYYGIRRFGGRVTELNTLHDDGRVRYRKLKRRALRVFRNILGAK